MLSTQKKIQHLYMRAGFMPTPDVAMSLAKGTVEDAVKKLFADSNASTELNSADESEISVNTKNMTEDEKKDFEKKKIHNIFKLNEEWIGMLTTTNAVLREKMTFFWHGHFACRSIFGYYSQQLNNDIRRNALGSFADMLTAVSKAPAMLQFLNNQQNRKDSPNENFAREVMELFTLGRGNYTEDDIKNAARAFTGWRFKLNGEFDFREKQHDEGDKTFLGKTGNFNGDDILKIILEQPQTSKYITKKIYRFFVNEEVDEDRCAELAEGFRKDYDIGKLMHKILTADWFYDEKNVGNKIKSPIDLLVNMQRAVPLQFKNENIILYGQKILGQVLFFPPNVAGWPGGKNWIDSSSLMFRLTVPGIVYNQEETSVQPKENPEEDEHKMMQEETMQPADAPETQKPTRAARKLFATPDWTNYLAAFANVPSADLYTAITDYLIQPLTSDFKEDTISKYVVKDTREQFIKSLTVALMSLPEYQLC